MMIRSLDGGALSEFMTDFYELPDHSCRPRLEKFAREQGVAV